MVGDRFIVHSDTEGAMKLRPFLRPLCGGRTGLTTGIKKGAGAGGYGQVPSPRDSDRFRRDQLHRRVLRLRMVFGSESIPVPAKKLIGFSAYLTSWRNCWYCASVCSAVSLPE